MTRRRQRRRLADMTMYPPEPPEYVPPPHDDQIDRHRKPADEVAIHVVGRYLGNRLVDFSVTLDWWTGIRWQHVLRVDCAHGEVHQHRFLRKGGQERTVFQPLTPRNADNALEMWCARATAMVDYEWRDYLKEWTDAFQ
jgi:hypothetical protein